MRQRCRYSKKISHFMDHELSETGMDEIRRHLVDCLDCRTQLSRLQEATDLLLDMPEVVPSSDFDTRFQEKLAATGATAMPEKAFSNLTRPGAGVWHRILTMLCSAWRPYVVGAVAMGVLALLIFKYTGVALTPEELLLAENLEILQEYEILSYLDLFEYWDVVENGVSGS